MANIQRKRTQGKRRRGNPWLAVAGYGGLGVGCLLLAAVTFLVLAAPVDLVRDRLVEEVRSRTGRDLVVSGPASLVLFPKLAISLADVSLSPPPGMGGEPTLKVETLRAELPLLALVSQQAGIGRIVLSRPVVELRVDAQGRRSWDVAVGPRAERPQRAAPGGDAPRQGGRERRPTGAEPDAAALEKLAPFSVSIVGGSLRYVDERAGSRYELASLDVNLTHEQAGGPLEAKGELVWQGEKVTFEGVLSPVQALLREQEARVAFKLAGRPIEANYEGTLSLASGLDVKGDVSVKAPSAQALGAWLARSVVLAQDPGPLNLSSKLSAGAGEASLSQLSATLGDTSLSGALKIATTGTRPRVSGNLQVSELDFGRILVRAAASSAPPPAKRLSNPADLPLAKNVPAKSPEVRGFTKRDGAGADWSDDIIDFAPLGLADADLALSADRVNHKDLKIGPSRLTLKLDNKIARITLEDMQLYGGRGRGALTLDGSGQVPATSANLTLQGVSASPLLKDALGFEWLEGRSTIKLELTSQGVSERRMVETLNGKVDMVTANGTIRGFDVDKLVRNIEQGRLGDLGVSAAEKTPFSEFAGSYTISNGIAQNNDLRLVSAGLRVTGEGTIDMPQRRLDYTVSPKLAGGTASPGAVINVKNIEIPVRIEGSWDKPSFSVKGQEQLIETVRQIGKSIKSKEVEEALKGLFGGADGQRTKPRDLIEKFLKKQ